MTEGSPPATSVDTTTLRVLPRFLRVVFAAYAVGALLGTGPLLLDWIFRSGVINRRSLTGFSLMGGLAALLSASLLRALRGSDRWHAPAIGAFGSFLALEVLYLINVALLPNHGALSPVSLLWDLVAVGAAVAGVSFALRARNRLARVPGDQVLPIAGAVLLVGAMAQLVETWPVEPEAPHRRGVGPNLVVITIDAARRDHLGLYGYAGATSPQVDAWASRARIYDRAFAGSSWTLNSVPVMLGSESGDPGAHPLVDALKARGYVAACFSDNPLFERDGALSVGFDYVGHSTGAAPRVLRTLFDRTFVGDFVILWPWLARSWDDGRLVDRALRWAEGVEGPLFLYVHLMDAQMPYRKPPIDGRGWRQRRLESPRSGMSISPQEAEDIVARYDAGIRSVDSAAGRVLRAAREWQRPFLAMVTADHGESLGEGSRWGHGKTLAPELLDVPLLVVGDGVRPGRVDKPVGHISVSATLLRAAGAPGAAGGASDLRTGTGDAVVEGGLPPSLRYRVALGYQIVMDSSTGETGLFDIQRDPRRENNVCRLYPALVQELTEGVAGASPAPPEAGVLEPLRALGYLDE